MKVYTAGSEALGHLEVFYALCYVTVVNFLRSFEHELAKEARFYLWNIFENLERSETTFCDARLVFEVFFVQSLRDLLSVFTLKKLGNRYWTS